MPHNCSVDGCLKPIRTRGMCIGHYGRWWKGLPVDVPLREFHRPLIERLMEKVEFDLNGGCWLWTGALDTHGYGQLGVNRLTTRTHRISYNLFKGEIEDDCVIDHTCRVRCCINPNHLEMVSNRVNIQRGFEARGFNDRTHCRNGHLITPDNTRMNKGYRACRDCQLDSERRYRERQAARVGAF